MNKIISFITGLLVLFLAGAAFVLSYDALYLTALANGVTPWLCWLWPLCLDSVMVASSLSVLRNGLVSERAIYPWFLVGAFTLASITFNVLHAPASWLARSVFALPPLVTFLCFELFASQVKSASRRRGMATTLQAMNEALSRARIELAELDKRADEQEQVATLAQVENAEPLPPARIGKYDDFRLAQLARDGDGPMSANEVMARFGVPKRTAYNWIGKFNESVGAVA